MSLNLQLDNATGQGISLVAIVGSILGWFPALAAAAAFLWYLILIYQSKTVQRWLHARRVRRVKTLKRELARLEAAEQIMGPR